MYYLSIDPGVSSGWARFDEGSELVACGGGTAAPPITVGLSRFAGVIIEKPQVYPARQSKGSPNDLITLGVQVGRYVERYETLYTKVTLVLPHEWKGGVPKEVHHPRIYGALTTREQGVVDECGRGLGKKALGDLMDAVGLGKYAFRMKVFK